MSLSDVVQFVGTSSVPVVVAGTVLGVFELGEKLASQRAKDALSKWLLTFDVRKVGAVPDGTREIFERIFGERHFSIRCFIRSTAFSLGSMAFLFGLIFLLYQNMVLNYTIDDFLYIAAPIQLALWLPFSILVDYISLYKTRIILRILSRMQRRTVIAAVAILVADFIVYKVIFSAGFIADILASLLWLGIPIDLTGYTPSFIFNIIAHVYTDVTQVENMALFVLFWAGLAPSLWMWLYVLALFTTRVLLRSEKLVNRLRWLLEIEKAPFRSIGAVAAFLAFIASVAILNVSAEVSRITAAA